MGEHPKTSIIITTYNNKDVLHFVLETALNQTVMPDEIVVADDGSCDDTAEMVFRIAQTTPVPVLHTWHSDSGFRASRSRNNGIAVSSGDYLIFLDGDCYLNRFFVEDHLSFACEGVYVVGTRVNILPKRWEYVLRTRDGHISVFSWGTHKKLNALRSRLLSRFHKHGGMASANFAAWRSDIVRVNGFHELFIGHGGEDREIAQRLDHAGLTRRKMVHLGMAYHIAHPYNAKGDQVQLHEIIAKTVNEKLCRCHDGLDRAVHFLASATRDRFSRIIFEG